ncbi:hypothetical protein HOY82DRAFT_617960 [Tuber indicum]|nr:hypothetical protein HOY82DRAFT_617960 [Tuber indicum]
MLTEPLSTLKTEADSTTSSYWNSLNYYLNESSAQAHLAARLKESLEYTKVAQLVCANRQKRTCHGMQKGSVLYAGDARTMIKKCQEDETAKRIEQTKCQLNILAKMQVAERKKMWKPIFKDLKQSV